jgi:hypothetical protein
MDTVEGRHTNLTFILWMDAQWTAWAQANGVKRHAPKSKEDLESFAQFIGAMEGVQ